MQRNMHHEQTSNMQRATADQSCSWAPTNTRKPASGLPNESPRVPGNRRICSFVHTQRVSVRNVVTTGWNAKRNVKETSTRRRPPSTRRRISVCTSSSRSTPEAFDTLTAVEECRFAGLGEHESHPVTHNAHSLSETMCMVSTTTSRNNAFSTSAPQRQSRR